jgi:hypothetical protein
MTETVGALVLAAESKRPRLRWELAEVEDEEVVGCCVIMSFADYLKPEYGSSNSVNFVQN